MRASLRKRTALPEAGVVAGPARVDPRTKALTKRLRPGDIAVIDHLDLDRVSAEALVACQPSVVLNAARSTSGRYPNLGPEILVEAGIPLVDDLGADVMAVTEGHRLRVVDGARVRRRRRSSPRASLQTDGDASRRRWRRPAPACPCSSSRSPRTRWTTCAASGTCCSTASACRTSRTEIDGRHVLIVVRGYHYKEDLVTLRPYIREYRPVLIGVDGGADAILDAGWKPDLIVGDMDSVSDRALTCGAEVVVHAYRDGRAPGLARVEQLGVHARRVPGHRHQRGRRDAARRRQGRRAHRRRRHARHARRVPRQGPLRHGEHVPDAPAGRQQARRRQGRVAALPEPDLEPPAHAAGPRRPPRPRRRARLDRGGPDHDRPARRPRRRHHLVGRRSVRMACLPTARTLHLVPVLAGDVPDGDLAP